jgi:NitT/TauT family transport system substrate-binding protein
MEKAFRSGQGDYIHLQGPVPQQLELDRVGAVVAAMGEAVPPVAFSSLMAQREFLDTDEARAFMRAYRRAMQWVIGSPAREIAEAEASFFPSISVEAIANAISRYQQLGTWREDIAINREQYEMAMDIFIFAGIFKERYRYEDVVVRSI